jgi:hypothetical protein
MLLMDEPSMGLAPLLVRQVAQTILDLNAQGVTVLLVEQLASIGARGGPPGVRDAERRGATAGFEQRRGSQSGRRAPVPGRRRERNPPDA